MPQPPQQPPASQQHTRHRHATVTHKNQEGCGMPPATARSAPQPPGPTGVYQRASLWPLDVVRHRWMSLDAAGCRWLSLHLPPPGSSGESAHSTRSAALCCAVLHNHKRRHTTVPDGVRRVLPQTTGGAVKSMHLVQAHATAAPASSGQPGAISLPCMAPFDAVGCGWMFLSVVGCCQAQSLPCAPRQKRTRPLVQQHAA